jgi:outer membrane protein assembly factor BamB
MKRLQFHTPQLALAVASLFLIGPPLVGADNWPGFRGPTGLGYTEEKDLPLTWNGKSGENVLWKTPIPGVDLKKLEFSSPGHSCPIVWRDRVFITTAIWPAQLTAEERKKTIAEHHVLCFQVSDGKQLWDTIIPPGKCLVDNGYHGYAVPTPVTDGQHVFALFGSGVLVCLDFDGQIVWREELPHLRDVDGGICSSPILHKETVIVPGIADSGLRALEKATGKLRWEQKTRDRNKMPTPALLRIGDKLQLIHYAGGIQALDPDNGELLWFCRTPPTSYSSPAFGGGLLYADAGRGGQKGAAVDPTGKGDVTKTNVKWEIKVTSPAGSSPIVVGAYLYRICDNGLLRCWKVDSGELVYEERLPKITPSASPIATADGRIYFASPARSYVIKAGPNFELLATNDLDLQGGSQDYTTPAVSEGRLFFKGRSYLWCIGKK